MSHAISWDCPSCKRPGKLVPASMGDPAFWICANTNCGNMNAVPAPRREDAAGAGSNAELLLMFADVICPKLRDLLVPHGASATNWDDAAKQLRGIAAALSTAEGERDELQRALGDVVVKCIPSGTQDGDFVLLYKIPTGPIHHAIPLLDSMGITVRPGFDGRARVPSGGEEGR